MAKALLLTIHSRDIVGIAVTIVWLLLIVIVLFAYYGFKHGWFIPNDETVRRYREHMNKRQKTCP